MGGGEGGQELEGRGKLRGRGVRGGVGLFAVVSMRHEEGKAGCFLMQGQGDARWGQLVCGCVLVCVAVCGMCVRVCTSMCVCV